MGLLVSVVASIGSFVASVATSGCIIAFIDEPTMPKSMIER